MSPIFASETIMLICVLRPILQLVLLNISSSCYSSFPTSSSFISVDVECSDYLSTFTVCIKDILEAIKELKPKLSTGIDGIPSFIIKGCSMFAPVLMHIFNLSCAQGYFPELWKFSAAVPIFKPGDSTLVNNYQPVSLLCGFAKVFEKRSPLASLLLSEPDENWSSARIFKGDIGRI